MTIDTQEALRQLNGMDADMDWKLPSSDGYWGQSLKLRALLSAKEGEPSGEHWAAAVAQWKAKHGWYTGDRLFAVCEIEALAIALRDAEKEKGNG